MSADVNSSAFFIFYELVLCNMYKKYLQIVKALSNIFLFYWKFTYI